MGKKLQKLYLLILAACLTVLWHFLSLGRKTLLFPSPYEVLQSLVSVITGKTFALTVFNTVKSVIISFAAALIPAMVLAVASKLIPLFYLTMEKIAGIIRSVPSVAIILMALLLLPVSITPVVICFFVVFPVLYTNISEGLVEVDHRLLEMAKIYQVPLAKKIRHIYMPSVKPFIIAGSRSALGLSYKIIVTAEVFNFVNHNTIGAQMYMRKIQIDLAGIIAWAIVVIVLSLLFDTVLKKLFEENNR